MGKSCQPCVILILQDGGHSVANLLPFLIWPCLIFRKVQRCRHTKFRPDISIHGRDITTSGFWKTAAILKFYLRFRFWLYNVIGMWFCTGLKFHANWMKADDFVAAIASKSTSGFWFGHVWHLGRPKAIGIPNFDQISQSTAEILLVPIFRNKRPPYWNSTSGFNFHFSLPSACGFPSAHQISSKSDHPRQNYDVIAIFKMAAVSHVGFGLGQWWPPTKCKWWSLLYPQILAWSNLPIWRYSDFHILGLWFESASSRPLLRCFGGTFSTNDVIYRRNP